MKNNDRNYYKLQNNFDLPEGCSRIIYRVWWMVIVNLTLKIIQPFTKAPFLVNAVSTMDEDGNPHFDKYVFCKTSINDTYINRIKSSILSGKYIERFYKENSL